MVAYQLAQPRTGLLNVEILIEPDVGNLAMRGEFVLRERYPRPTEGPLANSICETELKCAWADDT